MYRGRLAVSLTTAALVAAVLPALGAVPAEAAPERAVSHKRVVLTASIEGYPRGTEPGRHLQSATVSVDYDHTRSRAWIKADVVLRAAPPDSTSLVEVGVGLLVNGNHCQVHDRITRDLRSTSGTRVEVIDPGQFDTRWNCALVLVHPRGSVDPADVYDAMVGRLTNSYIQPRLAVSRPRLLDKAQKQVRLVRGVAQNHTLLVKNTGLYRARNVVVTARGKGMKAVRRNAGTLQPGEEMSVTVPLRLRSKSKRTAVRFTVAGSGVKASRVVRVRSIKAPAKPRAGAWRSTNKSFTFKVKNGRIVNFRGMNMRMQCGGYGTFPTYRNVSATFPTAKVPRHGYVDAMKRYRQGNVWYTATLRGRVVGTKMTQARYTYSTAGSCRVSEGFTARRR